MSLIRLHLNRFGHMELAFANARVLRRVLQVVIKNGGPSHRTAYLQHDGDVQSLIEELPPQARRDLQAGWDVTVRMDPWYAAHYYGYDAHTAFESKP
jgi:hypothetical protein